MSELSPDHNEDLLSELQSQHPGDLETALEDDVDAISGVHVLFLQIDNG